MVRRVFLGVVAIGAAAVSVACGGDSGGVQADPSVAPFVGTWIADSMTVTNDADTTVVANILEFGSFTIAVEPSGQYTATLTVSARANVEIGQLTVIGSALTLTPSFPAGRSPATSDYVFVTEDFLILDGATAFDFNLDGTPEAAQGHIELQRD